MSFIDLEKIGKAREAVFNIGLNREEYREFIKLMIEYVNK